MIRNGRQILHSSKLRLWMDIVWREYIFYQGNHIRVNDQKVGKAVVVKAVVRYYDVFKDPNKYELVSVFDESNIDLAGQGYIYGEDGDRLLGVDQIDVYDSNQPIKYLRAMDDKDIGEVNRKLNTVQIK